MFTEEEIEQFRQERQTAKNEERAIADEFCRDLKKANLRDLKFYFNHAAQHGLSNEQKRSIHAELVRRGEMRYSILPAGYLARSGYTSYGLGKVVDASNQVGRNIYIVPSRLQSSSRGLEFCGVALQNADGFFSAGEHIVSFPTAEAAAEWNQLYLEGRYAVVHVERSGHYCNVVSHAIVACRRSK